MKPKNTIKTAATSPSTAQNRGVKLAHYALAIDIATHQLHVVKVLEHYKTVRSAAK